MQGTSQHVGLPPGIATLARYVGRVALWLLARPFVVSLRIAIAAFSSALALGTGVAFLGAPWWASAFFFSAAILSALVCVGWARLVRKGDRRVVYIASFSYEAPSDEYASAQHHYMLLERIRANVLLSEAVEIRQLDNVSLNEAQRIS